MFEQHEVEVLEGKVVEPEAPAPRLGEGGLQQEEIGQEPRQRGDQHGIAERHPAPTPERDRAALASLAGQRHEALAAGHQPLHDDEHHRHDEKRHGVGRRDFDPHRIAEELKELRGHHVEARRNGDHRRRRKQRDSLQETDDQAAQDRRQRERQGDAPHGEPGAGAEDVGCILHL